jgi:ABC-2 type transport system ATP-binding protein
MLGMVYPDAGEVRIGGVSVQSDRDRALRRVGAIFEAPVFYDYLSGWQNLRILAALSGFTDTGEMRRVVELVGLSGRIRNRVGTYSHGMRQRLALAQALVPTPEVLLLDEPTDGLDPEGIREFREFVQRLRREQGLTILFNSHLLAEVERLCDRVAIIKAGRLLYVGDGADLRGTTRVVAVEADNWPRFLDAVRPLGVTGVEEGRVEVPVEADLADVVARAVESGVRLRSVVPAKEGLEELYLKVSR